ncbi:hypothetical protein DH2020_037657 [Rehmannia glutinosa]|uniref:Late embryogenesis abundant protein, LEA-18 n=1 Tax=Rehmannia glutinosa TaxID=99300 RepID=A0ABR0V0X6_REHGL
MEKKQEHEKKVDLEGLPTETSPYTQYKDLEDYKKQGYGTQGHLQPESGRGAAGSTDAPTLAGGGATADPKAQLSATDAINRQDLGGSTLPKLGWIILLKLGGSTLLELGESILLEQ